METIRSTVESVAAKASATFSGKKAVHFGGGNIGRGFVAEHLHKAGYEVVFLDVVDKLIDQLQNAKSYKVTEIGAEGQTTFTITNYRAINSKHEEQKAIDEISTADVVTCAVGPNILKFIAPVIAKGIDKRPDSKDTPLAVIACENAIGATDTLKGFIDQKLETLAENLPKKARFANSAIDRIVPDQDPNAGLDVTIEKFYEWCVDKSPFVDAKGGHPNITSIHWVDDLTPYIERKLYTVNTSHAAAAYYGYNRGKKLVHDAMEDAEIRGIVEAAVGETAHLITNKHGITQQDQDEYVKTIITRISNPHLADRVERVGRAPMRKLGRKERFVGPAAQLAENGDKVDALLGCIEMALRFQNVEGDEESAELAKVLKENDSKEAVKKLCGLDDSHPLFSKVEEVVKKVQSG